MPPPGPPALPVRPAEVVPLAPAPPGLPVGPVGIAPAPPGIPVGHAGQVPPPAPPGIPAEPAGEVPLQAPPGLPVGPVGIVPPPPPLGIPTEPAGEVPPPELPALPLGPAGNPPIVAPAAAPAQLPPLATYNNRQLVPSLPTGAVNNQQQHLSLSAAGSAVSYPPAPMIFPANNQNVPAPIQAASWNSQHQSLPLPMGQPPSKVARSFGYHPLNSNYSSGQYDKGQRGRSRGRQGSSFNPRRQNNSDFDKSYNNKQSFKNNQSYKNNDVDEHVQRAADLAVNYFNFFLIFCKTFQMKIKKTFFRQRKYCILLSCNRT